MRDFHLFCSHWVGVLGGGLSPWVTRSEPPKDKIKRPEGHSTRSWVPEDLQTSSESIFLKRKHLSKFICEKLKKRRCVKHISKSLDSQVYLPPTHAVSICRTQTNKNILLFARSLNAVHCFIIKKASPF